MDAVGGCFRFLDIATSEGFELISNIELILWLISVNREKHLQCNNHLFEAFPIKNIIPYFETCNITMRKCFNRND